MEYNVVIAAQISMLLIGSANDGCTKLYCYLFRDIETINSELPDNRKQLEKAKTDLKKTEAEEKKLCDEVLYVVDCSSRRIFNI
jgi:hypothetical protein